MHAQVYGAIYAQGKGRGMGLEGALLAKGRGGGGNKGVRRREASAHPTIRVYNAGILSLAPQDGPRRPGAPL